MVGRVGEILGALKAYGAGGGHAAAAVRGAGVGGSGATAALSGDTVEISAAARTAWAKIAGAKAVGAAADATGLAEHSAAAEDGLAEISGMLAELKGELKRGRNETASERNLRQVNVDSILAGVDRIAATAGVGDLKLLDGSGVLSKPGKAMKIDSARIQSLGKLKVGDETLSLADIRSGGKLNVVDGNVTAAGVSVGLALGEVGTIRGRIETFSAESKAGAVIDEAQNLYAARLDVMA